MFVLGLYRKKMCPVIFGLCTKDYFLLCVHWNGWGYLLGGFFLRFVDILSDMLQTAGDWSKGALESQTHLSG